MRSGRYKGRQIVKQVSDGVGIIKQNSGGGLRKIQCPNCNGTAVPVNNGSKIVWHCQTAACRSRFTMTKM